MGRGRGWVEDIGRCWRSIVDPGDIVYLSKKPLSIVNGVIDSLRYKIRLPIIRFTTANVVFEFRLHSATILSHILHLRLRLKLLVVERGSVGRRDIGTMEQREFGACPTSHMSLQN